MGKEIIDIINSYGDPTGQTIDRETAHAKGIPHRTSHVWLARKHDGAVQILIQKRSQNKDSHPGCYDISSAGHIPAGCSFETSAIRELKEELGVTAAESDLIFCGTRTIVWDDFFHGKPFHDRQISRVFLLWMDPPEFSIQEEELESVTWIDFDDCIAMVQNNTEKNCISLEELRLIEKELKK